MTQDAPVIWTRRSLMGALGVGAAAPTILQASQTDLRGKLLDVRRWIDGEVESDRITGAAVSIGRNGGVVWEGGFGLADVASGRRATPTTSFGLASVTKPFTTAAAAVLASKGRIDLDASIERVLPFALPSSPFGVAGLTPRRLGSHSSGLPSFFQMATVPNRPPSAATLARDFGRAAFAPGTLYEYSNLGFALLGAALANLEDVVYEEAVRRSIIRPMGLRDTCFLSEPVIAGRAATRYADDGAPLPFYTTETPASGELCSSAHDLTIFAAHVMGVHRTPALSSTARTEILKPSFRSGDAFSAFGWMGYQVAGQPVLVKNGGDPGVAVRLTLLPDLGMSIAVMTNRSNDGFVAEVSDRLAAIFVEGWVPRSEDLAPPVISGRPSSDYYANWRGTLSNKGVMRQTELKIANDGALCRIGDGGWSRWGDFEISGCVIVGRCDGAISSNGERSGGQLSFRLVNHQGRLVGRVLERTTNSILPFVLDLAKG